MLADPTCVARPSRRSIAAIEEQREAVKRQKVADLLQHRRREREAASKKTSTSDEAKAPPPPFKTVQRTASRDDVSSSCTLEAVSPDVVSPALLVSDDYLGGSF